MGTNIVSSSSSSSSSGIGFFGLLGIVFIVLKLCGIINWSWWIVTLPLWGGFIILSLWIVIVAIIAYIAGRY